MHPNGSVLNKPFSTDVLKMLLIVTLFVSVWPTVRAFRHWSYGIPADFRVYDTAATLVRSDQSNHIYDGANKGEDPQFKLAPDETVFAGIARSLGVSKVGMYVYPPILADLFVPFTYFPTQLAANAWALLNIGMMVGCCLLLHKIVGVRWYSAAGIAVIVGLAGMYAAITSLLLGQITIVLLFTWAVGIYCQKRGWPYASGIALALATVIKLTPLIAVIPFVVWREWRWLRGFALSVVGFLIVMCVVNSPAVVIDYFLHVTPAMSRGIPHPSNRSILSCVQLTYAAIHGGTFAQMKLLIWPPIPSWVTLLGKLISVSALASATATIYQKCRQINVCAKSEVLAAFAALSAVISPVSWLHAYVIVFPILIFLWRRAFLGQQTKPQTVLLIICTYGLIGFRFDGFQHLLSSEVMKAALAWNTPILALTAIGLMLQAPENLKINGTY